MRAVVGAKCRCILIKRATYYVRQYTILALNVGNNAVYSELLLCTKTVDVYVNYDSCVRFIVRRYVGYTIVYTYNKLVGLSV